MRCKSTEFPSLFKGGVRGGFKTSPCPLLAKEGVQYQSVKGHIDGELVPERFLPNSAGIKITDEIANADPAGPEKPCAIRIKRQDGNQPADVPGVDHR